MFAESRANTIATKIEGQRQRLARNLVKEGATITIVGAEVFEPFPGASSANG